MRAENGNALAPIKVARALNLDYNRRHEGCHHGTKIAQRQHEKFPGGGHLDMHEMVSESGVERYGSVWYATHKNRSP